MVQNKGAEPRRRGRPRAYDPQAALQQATDTFWRSGYSGTSLDEIGAATGMNRPSLYAAFGDKHTLYLKALEHYWQLSLVKIREALAESDQTLEQALMRAYDGQLSIYFSGDGPPRGCLRSEPQQPRRSKIRKSEAHSQRDFVRSTPISKRASERRERAAS